MSTIIAVLAQRIQAAHEDKAGPTIAAIGGAADPGKSHLVRQLVDEFQRCGYSSDVLALDSFLIDRAARKSRGVSGYDLEAYDLDQAVDALASLARRSDRISSLRSQAGRPEIENSRD